MAKAGQNPDQSFVGVMGIRPPASKITLPIRISRPLDRDGRRAEGGTRTGLFDGSRLIVGP
jgi:hypothetical protein